MHDYVAARALMPLFHAKIGRWQTASIPGRGINDARKAIRKWVRERDSRVFVKLDVVKCYPSIDRAVLKAMLAHDVGDRRLLRLMFALVDQYRGDRGLNIGSYLSQWLANYYLSAAWHYAEGSLFAVRRSRRRQGEEIRRRLVTHVLFYADDILLIGRSKRDLTIAVKRLRRFLRDRLHLEIHPTWNVKHIGAEPIDMVGYTFRPGRTGVRPAIFLRAERAYSRAAKRPMTMAMARKCISYYGWLYHSDSVAFRRRHDIDRIFHQARHVVSAAKTGRTTQ
ncbi:MULTISPECIES: reverse transcriptase domain-containing protein [Bifidobacterium]|uniref:reverse transcriptase domain-containing protein n=1 Tax=Bifidobacterium TaxID=1678 RepID=UPI001EDB81EB|nr:reverse transcriptase domain-containing protein [Bifidobacterium pseudocatenulatum]MDB1508844.1 reverse transcriptase domain-containing protein [Bifidobacterium adolescentis]MCG4623285.1 reverse transcriptase [Bifidobacterium pseudocatenulatum]MCG4630521.1 reverse transcriptase [Bifidobacterium pseudocatenulatum]MDB1514899.1 reverse transcriptase domain-containing protein [Bifidobacterium adolescentis]MDB1516827.1 reverse transcriptase domain-containing protein [Bifidobacterium adolescentis